VKPRLLLYLTAESNPARNAVAATLAWAAEAAGWAFEVYYDAYRLGDHYGGGDPDSQPPGMLSGGTVVGGHHHERLYLLLNRFDTLVLTDGPVAFGATLDQLDVERRRVSGYADTYREAFAALAIAPPDAALVIDASPRGELAGLDAYLYPEIACRRVLGLDVSSLTGDELTRLVESGVRRVDTLFVGAAGAERWPSLAAGAGVVVTPEPLDALGPEDDFASVTERVARRWLAECAGGWVLADPAVVSAWLPEAWRQRRLAIYGKPQRAVIDRLEDELGASGKVVLGRQYEDGDFFALSALGLPFQLIDPVRPPFPVLRLAPYAWTSDSTDPADAGVYGREPSDDQLRTWAEQGRVLVSAIFWTGMIRELENLPRLVDLVALTGMKGGLALTTAALEYQPDGPLEMLRVPLERGGVFPCLEMLLASCGEGAAIESLLPEGRLAEHLRVANDTLDRLGVPAGWRPRGWWSTMDPAMVPLPGPRLPATLAANQHPPFVRVRYAARATGHGVGAASAAGPAVGMTVGDAPVGETPAGETPVGEAPRPGLRRRVGDWARGRGLGDVLAPYRPYEFFAPGPFRAEVAAAVGGAGLSYLFSKAGFGRPPTVLHEDAAVIALNYTVGHWDGWTPFETINDVEDLRGAERRLLAAKRPGWLVGTLDSCLWAFSGSIWGRAPGLHAIGGFLARGGDSGRLINVTPHVVARYARVIGR
jgi:hypothetical protein